MIKKSLLATFDFPPVRGGISSFMLNIAQALPADSAVVLTLPADHPPAYRFPVYRKKLISTSRLIWPHWLPMLRAMHSLVKKEHIGIIQVGQILPFGACALILKKILRIPYIVYVYGNDLVVMRHSGKKMGQIRSILKNAEAVIACSHFTKHLAEATGAVPERTHVVYPCPTIRPPLEFDQQEIDQFKNSRHLNGKKILITVGHLVLRKGHHLVLGALSDVIKRNAEIVYIIAGHGPQYAPLQHDVRLRRLEPYVQFWPQVTHHDLQKLYRACDVLVMPSQSIKNKEGELIDIEGFGIVFVEANLYGKPVIGGYTGGVPEAVKNGVSGLVVNPENRAELAGAITRLLQDERFAQQLGQQGRRRAIEKFNWDAEMNKLKKILNG